MDGPTASAGEGVTRGFLFADLRGYSQLVEARGAVEAKHALERYRALTRDVVSHRGGAEIKTEGDSFYVVLPSASAAVRCGLDLVAASLEPPDGGDPISVGGGHPRWGGGFQRDDRRELFGFLDGVRNVRSGQRHATIYVDRDVTPEEPGWTEDGSYLAYLKIRQDLDRWRQLPLAERERIMGRRETDGSRLDLPPGSNPHAEGDFGGEPPASAAHVRKSGPRGARDAVQVFRRGVPYLTLDTDGRTNAGLHFVSFQASPDQFEVVLQRWMLNPRFPTDGAGADLLFGNGMVSLERGACSSSRLTTDASSEQSCSIRLGPSHGRDGSGASSSASAPSTPVASRRWSISPASASGSCAPTTAARSATCSRRTPPAARPRPICRLAPRCC